MTTTMHRTEGTQVQAPMSSPQDEPEILIRPITMPLSAVYGQASLYANYPAFQREEVWPLWMKRELIDSALRLHPVAPIPLVKSTRHGKTIYEVIDGQQRLSTFFAYLDNAFKTAGIKRMVDGTLTFDTIEPNRTFSQLTQEARDRLNFYPIRFDIYEKITPEQLSLIYIRSQNHVPLTVAERLKAQNSHATRFALLLGATHPLFHDTENALYRGRTHRAQPFYAVLHALVLEVMGGFASLGSDVVKDLAEGRKDRYMTPLLQEKVTQRFDLLFHLYQGVRITSPGDIVPLYQSVALLEQAGFDLAHVPGGVLTPWFSQVQEEEKAQTRRGYDGFASRMRKVFAQENFWRNNLLGVAQLPGVTTLDKRASFDEIDLLLRWMDCDRECRNCRKRVGIGELHAHIWRDTDVRNAGTCRDQKRQVVGIGLPQGSEV